MRRVTHPQIVQAIETVRRVSKEASLTESNDTLQLRIMLETLKQAEAEILAGNQSGAFRLFLQALGAGMLGDSEP